jgi:uncharacterized membrane-anchored protein
MKAENLPSIGARYWSAIVVASMAGANTGDFAARYLHLGHTKGLLPFALLFIIILWAEIRSRRYTEAYYWLAIIVLRTAATNLADLATHDLALGYGLTMAGLTVLIITVLILAAPIAPRAANVNTSNARKLPTTDMPYWIAMLTAGTLGTAAGDFTADQIGLGIGSLVLGIVFLSVLFPSTLIGKMALPWYWASIVAARTVGTTLGDFLASRHGLDLGLPLSTGCTLSSLAAIIVFWPDPLREQLRATQTERS